ncbi:hypothetical protein ACIHCX_16550 [Streptomyces sp. NPDC052043]|uniref:hypothetical protein n=1 Tax=Streptomyces sp. NPDC052043 TaxID=3365684 RepID=UPI0037CD69CB
MRDRLQNAKASAGVPTAGLGDAVNMIAGRRRSIITDTLGLLVADPAAAAQAAQPPSGELVYDHLPVQLGGRAR